MSRLTIAITGGTGFIGTELVKLCLDLGHSVRISTRQKQQELAITGVDIFNGDFKSTLDWAPFMSGVDILINVAAELNDEAAMRVVNFETPIRILRCAQLANVKRWVQLSSVGAYGHVSFGTVSENWPDNPNGAYERSKADFDTQLHRAMRKSSMEICIVRPSNVYGFGMRNQSIFQLINALKSGTFAFIGPGGASANYVHVRDLVHALQLCAFNPKAANQTYIVSAWATMEEMVSGLAAGAGIVTPSRRIPLCVATLLAKAMKWWPWWPLTLSRVRALSLRSRYSTEKIEKELGWKVTVPVKEGMRQLAQDMDL